MKLYLLSLILFLAACTSEKATVSQPEGALKNNTVVTDKDYQPIEGGLDVIASEDNSPKKDQFQLILEEQLLTLPFYYDELPDKYEKKLSEAYRKAKDALDNYFLINLKAIESQITERQYEELMELKNYVSTRYIVVQTRLAEELINRFFDYKRIYARNLLNIDVFNKKLLSICYIQNEHSIDDTEELIEVEYDALDSVSKRNLLDFWGEENYIMGSGLKTIGLSEAVVIAEKLQVLREVMYDKTHCQNKILTAQKLYEYLLSNDISSFNTKYLSRDPQKAEQQANLISNYVETLLKLVSVKDFSYKVHGTLAKQYSRIFEAQMILYGPWADKSMIKESLSPYIYIPMAEKFLEKSKLSDKEFYAGIRCNMHQYNFFALQNSNKSDPSPLIPLNVDDCH